MKTGDAGTADLDLIDSLRKENSALEKENTALSHSEMKLRRHAEKCEADQYIQKLEPYLCLQQIAGKWPPPPRVFIFWSQINSKITN